jgi:diaminopimelate epimerase
MGTLKSPAINGLVLICVFKSSSTFFCYQIGSIGKKKTGSQASFCVNGLRCYFLQLDANHLGERNLN